MNTTITTIEPGDRLVDVRRACDIAGFRSTTMLYKQIRAGDFPPAVHVGRSARWVESEVRSWVGRKIAESRAASARAAA